MSQIFFTADPHFGHHNMIAYAERPFRDVEEMNRKLSLNINSRVQPEDTIFCIGDFCFKNTKGGKEGEGLVYNAKYYLDRLHANWILIDGNHDKHNSSQTHIKSIILNYGGGDIQLVHRSEDSDPKYKLVFCGHVHQLWKFRTCQETGQTFVNVGVDVWHYMPVKYNEIMGELWRWRKGVIK